MNKKRLQIEINEILNKSYIDKENKKNIIIISHSKNKSEDLKYNFKTDLIINTTKIKNSSKKKSEKSKKNIIKTDNRNANLLIKNYSVSNLLKNKNKKKYFFEPNFFCRANSRKKLNISYKKIKSSNKKEKHPLSELNISNNIADNSDTKNRKKRIIKIKNNSEIKDNLLYNKIKRNEINKIKIKDILYNKKEVHKKNNNKSNLIYLKSKISGIPYRNKRCPTSRLNWNKKDDNIKLNYIKSKEDKNKNNNNILEDSLDSHNTLIDENNINEFKYFSNNLSFQDLKKNEDILYKKIISRKKNILKDSLNQKYKKKLPRSLTKDNKIINNYTPKTSRINNEKYHNSYGININNNFIYKKVNTQRLSTSFSKNINYLLTSSLSTTRNQTDKYKDNLENIIVNKDVTEFIYSDDLFDNFPQKKISIKNWLNNLGLFTYSQNFYSKNIFDLNSLINKIKQQNCLYDYFENNYQIHLPGHIFRILIKLEIEEGIIDSQIANFFIKKEEYSKNLNKLKPSNLLQLYDSCDKFVDYSSINKNNIKIFLKKYHLNHLYHNFYQNGFELINFVILQMYSKKYAINDTILENCFHIYNKNERNSVLYSLKVEKSKVDLFLKSNEYKEKNKFNQTDNLESINLNEYNTYNNFDLYFNAKEVEQNGCKICGIF